MAVPTVTTAGSAKQCLGSCAWTQGSAPSFLQQPLDNAEGHCCIPLQVDAPPVDLEEYRSYRQATDLREPYRQASFCQPSAAGRALGSPCHVPQGKASTIPTHSFAAGVAAASSLCVMLSSIKLQTCLCPGVQSSATCCLLPAANRAECTLQHQPLHTLLQTPIAPGWCRIPHAFLQHIKKVQIPEVAEAPLIVFINSRSGGRAGPKLTEVLYHALGHSQVGWGWALEVFSGSSKDGWCQAPCPCGPSHATTGASIGRCKAWGAPERTGKHLCVARCADEVFSHALQRMQLLIDSSAEAPRAGRAYCACPQVPAKVLLPCIGTLPWGRGWLWCCAAVPPRAICQLRGRCT